MNTTFRAAALALTAALFASAPLSAQFRKYVALGNSITAGVQGNCLVERHQERSYPKIVATQLGITDFQQPLVGETRTVTNTASACLGAVVAGGMISVGPVSQMTAPLNAALGRPYDNLGIPSARAGHLVDLKTANPALGGVNASAALVLRNVAGSPFAGTSAVDQANSLQPDLITLWIGNNDVLGAALAGVALDGVTLTPAAAFAAKYNEVVTGLTATGRTLVILNVPDVAALPFTTTVPSFVVNPATRQPVLIGGQPVPLLGPRTTATCSTAPCPIPAGTLVTIQALPLLSQGLGVPAALGGTGQPLPDGGFTPPATLNAGVLLYPDEVAAIRNRTNEINGAIASAASSAGAILVDVHEIFEDIKADGYEIGGIELTSAFLTGGLFSADGFHPGNIAHAIIADEIVQALNEARDLTIPRPNIAEALFAPDVPPTTASLALSPNDVWRGLLDVFAPAGQGIQVLLPSSEERSAPVPAPRRRRGRG